MLLGRVGGSRLLGEQIPEAALRCADEIEQAEQRLELRIGFERVPLDHHVHGRHARTARQRGDHHPCPLAYEAAL